MYGVNAEILIGNIITGNRLSIGILQDGTVVDLNTVITDINGQIQNISEYKKYLTFNVDNGLIIGAVNDDGSINNNVFHSQQTESLYAFVINGKTPLYLDAKDGRVHSTSLECTDRFSIGSNENGGYLDQITTPNGIGWKWRAV